MQQYTSHYEYNNIKGKVKYNVPKMNNAIIKFNFYFDCSILCPYFGCETNSDVYELGH